MDLTHKGRQLLGDLPVSDLDDELAKDWKQVDELYRMIRFGPAPQTIAVSGPWGSGKTSLMKLARKRLVGDVDDDPKGVPTVWFNAWRYEKDENLVLPMLATIRQDLLTDGFIEPGGKTAGLLVRLAKASVGAMALNVGVAELSGGEFVDRFFDESGDEPSNAGLHFGFVAELERIVAELPGGRLVIFVDDLDRCLDEGVFRLIEMMKLLFDVPGVVFVVGVAAERVRQSVADHYKEDVTSDEATRADHYLEKIFQSWVGVSVDNERIVENFARVTRCPLVAVLEDDTNARNGYRLSLQVALWTLSISSPRSLALWIDALDRAAHRFVDRTPITVDVERFNALLGDNPKTSASTEEQILAIVAVTILCDWITSNKGTLLERPEFGSSPEDMFRQSTERLSGLMMSWDAFRKAAPAFSQQATERVWWNTRSSITEAFVMPTPISIAIFPEQGHEVVGARLVRP